MFAVFKSNDDDRDIAVNVNNVTTINQVIDDEPCCSIHLTSAARIYVNGTFQEVLTQLKAASLGDPCPPTHKEHLDALHDY